MKSVLQINHYSNINTIEYIGKRVGLAVQKKNFLYIYNGKIIENHPITNNKFNKKKNMNFIIKKQISRHLKKVIE